MRRELFSVLNFLVIFVCGIFFCILQSVIMKIPLFKWLHIDFILLLVIYLGITRTPLIGGLLVICLARLVEINSGSPVGLLMMSYYVTFIVIVVIRELIMVQGSISQLMVTLIGGAIFKVTFIIQVHVKTVSF